MSANSLGGPGGVKTLTDASAKNASFFYVLPQLPETASGSFILFPTMLKIDQVRQAIAKILQLLLDPSLKKDAAHIIWWGGGVDKREKCKKQTQIKFTQKNPCCFKFIFLDPPPTPILTVRHCPIHIFSYNIKTRQTKMQST